MLLYGVIYIDTVEPVLKTTSNLSQVTTIELSTVSSQPPSSTSTGRPPVYREHLS